MDIDIFTFGGVAPALTPWKLPSGMAQVSQNVNPDSLTVKPWFDAIIVSSGYTAADTTTIYRFGRSLISDTSYWFQWPYDVDVCKGPIVGDVTERTLWTGQGAPKWTNSTLALAGGPPYPQAYRDLGVIKPINPPVMSVTGTAASVDYQVVGYAYTNVTAYGEESAPSAICAGQKVYSGQTASLTGFDAAPTGTGSTVTRRLYRSVTSSTDTNLYFVKEVAIATATIVDDVGSNIGAVIATTSWDVPPSTLFGIVSMANGIMVGFTGNDVCVSAQYAPYAWPIKWKLSTDFPIVGGRAIGNQVVVLTLGNPYLLSGSTPDALSLTKIESPEACVSKRSIVNITAPMPTMMGANVMIGSVYYASQNGLCSCDSNGSVRVLTAGLLNRADWQALNPASIHGYMYNGRYFGFFNTGTVTGGFCFDPKGAQAALTLFPFYATGGFADIVDDHLLLQVGTNILLWNASGAPLTATWRSGVIETSPQAFKFVRVLTRAASVVPSFYNSGAYNSGSYSVGALTPGTATCNVYGDGLLIDSSVITDGRPFKINCDDKHFQWEVEIVTTTEVYRATLTTGLQGMRQAPA